MQGKNNHRRNLTYNIGVAKSIMGITNLNLRKIQIRNGETIGLNRPLMYMHPFPPYSQTNFYNSPLFNPVLKRIS